MTKVKVSDTQYKKISQYVDDLKRRLYEGSLSFSEFKKVTGPLIGQHPSLFPRKTSHLRLIAETTISATKAGKGINQGNKHPFDWIDSDFDNLDAQTVSKDTEEAKAFVYEQIQNGTYAQIFGSFNTNFDLLSFETHEQIKEFVATHPELLHPKGYATNFLYKNKSGKRFVAYVQHLSLNELHVLVSEFSYGLWDADDACRFVILATKNLDTQG